MIGQLSDRRVAVRRTSRSPLAELTTYEHGTVNTSRAAIRVTCLMSSAGERPPQQMPSAPSH
jgi:hypothetical protein